MDNPSQKEIDDLIILCEQRMKDVKRMSLGAKVHKIISLNFALANRVLLYEMKQEMSIDDFCETKELYDELGVLLAEVIGFQR